MLHSGRNTSLYLVLSLPLGKQIIYNSAPMQIHDIQAQIKKDFPEWKSLAELYKQAVTEHVTPETTVLDIGCGRTDYMKDVYQRAQEVIGQDPDESAINENSSIDKKLVGDFEVLQQLHKESVDVVVSSWTLEHLPDPNKLFTQLNYALKPGGVFIASTPNKYSLTSLISSIIPNKYHPKLVQKLWGRSEENTYPTFYRLNTRRDIMKYCNKYGFVIKNILFVKDPSYYTTSQNRISLLYRMHKTLLPKAMSEGMLITLQKV
jgi:2-polyprenyl-3-methyl-5-hydroxy-6-metoxy-1,4-benzoquinol methylase